MSKFKFPAWMRMRKVCVLSLALGLLLGLIVSFAGYNPFSGSKNSEVTLSSASAVQLAEHIVPRVSKDVGIWIQWHDDGHGSIMVPFIFEKTDERRLDRWAIGFDARSEKLQISYSPLPEELNIPDGHPALKFLAIMVGVSVLQGAQSPQAKKTLEFTKEFHVEEGSRYVNQLLKSYGMPCTQEDFALFPGSETKSGWTDSGIAILTGGANKQLCVEGY